jgi:precorrin-2/cobalt-factor-2 C20-methyltransferase
MPGTLHVIGVGPGDPELLTLKALRILKSTDVICVPKGREEGSSLALSIVEKAVSLDGKEIIEAHFPMRKTKKQGADNKELSGNYDSELDARWDETAKTILERLHKGVDVAFLTLGDPTIYSTFFYLYDRLLDLMPELDIRIIPGISSVNASAASAGISLSLADEKIAIVPATYEKDVKETLSRFDSVVLMKVHRVFDKVKGVLADMNLIDNAVYVSRAGMEDERIFRKIREVKEDDLNYFSMLIVKK